MATTSSGERSAGRGPPAPRARRPGRAGGGPAGWPASSSRVGQALLARRDQGDGVRGASACASKRRCRQRRPSATGPRSARSTPTSELAALRLGQQRQVRQTGGPGSAATPASSVAKWPGQPRRSWPRRTGRCRSSSEPPRRRPPSPPGRRREVELGGAGPDSTAARGRGPAAPGPPAGRSGAGRPRWNRGGRREVALRRQLLDQLLEGQVLVGVGAQAPSRDPAAAARGSAGRPRGPPRSTRVLTKKPISPSISRAVAAGDRRADQQSSWPGQAVEQRREGGEERP